MSNQSEDYKGYRELALEVMKKFGAMVWSDVLCKHESGVFEGIILPRSETADANHIVIKLATGYNVGLHANRILGMEIRGRKIAVYKIPEQAFPYEKHKPSVKLFGTGGTIASRLDYRTGAVIPAFSPGELYGSVPELADYCNLDTEKLYGVFSENMGGDEYIGLANGIAKAIDDGVDGIIIGHGTDTLHHTAAILSFMVQNTPIPIVLVGSQRSSDRPSSDAALNLMYSAKAAAESDIAEVMVCMFGPTSDTYGLLHPGTRVRKMHSSYRSTFRTLSTTPLAMVDRETITPLRDNYKKRRVDRNYTFAPYWDKRVGMVYYYPGMDPDMIDSMIEKGYKGIVIAGTGLGHVNKPLYPALKRAQEAGVAVYMTVQTLFGYAQMYVYETGREMMGLGVIALDNMLPEVAYMKLSWAFGQTDDLEKVNKLMLTTIAEEILDREPPNGYLMFQGGVPDVEEFIGSIRK